MSLTETSDQNSSFHWQCEPTAAAWIENVIRTCCQLKELAEFAEALKKETSTHLFDWIDYLSVAKTSSTEKDLLAAGFTQETSTNYYTIYAHSRAQLPRIVLQNKPFRNYEIAIKVESISDFLMVRGQQASIEGSLLSSFRKCCIATDDQIAFLVVEKRAYRDIKPTILEESAISKYLSAKELWQTRSRFSLDEKKLMADTLALAQHLVTLVGQDTAAWVVLEVERAYWQSRNTAGQIQKARQDRLGMGWANHDHHTFRSSREHFASLVQLFESLGFHCRERFYAGAEAGWGAQIMENTVCGLVLFLDVDLSPEEIAIDFAHESLPARPSLGTIGLWCALHGDSILRGGMHHLEAQFDFDLLREDLLQKGIQMMQPFSNFPYLKQAFTVGERWPVKKEVIQRLLEEKLISPEQAERFLKEGALGSHLENLQRKEGYKGFNQKNVSVIIRKTDPRNIS